MTTYIESGIYTNYTGKPAIYIGKYKTSTTQEDVVKFLRKKGTKILDCIIMLHSDNTDYNYNYLD